MECPVFFWTGLYSTAAVYNTGVDHGYRTVCRGTTLQVSCTESGFHLLRSQALESAAQSRWCFGSGRAIFPGGSRSNERSTYTSRMTTLDCHTKNRKDKQQTPVKLATDYASWDRAVEGFRIQAVAGMVLVMLVMLASTQNVNVILATWILQTRSVLGFKPQATATSKARHFTCLLLLPNSTPVTCT